MTPPLKNLDYAPEHMACIFLGSEAIDWFLANGFASSREEGVQLGQVITIPIYYIVINTDCSTTLISSGFLVLILLENPKSSDQYVISG